MQRAQDGISARRGLRAQKQVARWTGAFPTCLLMGICPRWDVRSLGSPAWVQGPFVSPSTMLLMEARLSRLVVVPSPHAPHQLRDARMEGEKGGMATCLCFCPCCCVWAWRAGGWLHEQHGSTKLVRQGLSSTWNRSTQPAPSHAAAGLLLLATTTSTVPRGLSQTSREALQIARGIPQKHYPSSPREHLARIIQN